MINKDADFNISCNGQGIPGLPTVCSLDVLTFDLNTVINISSIWNPTPVLSRNNPGFQASANVQSCKLSINDLFYLLFF